MYYRFIRNSDVIGNAVIFSKGNQVLAHQYEMPDATNAPTWKPLQNITPIQRFGREVYQAQTLNGNIVYASRSYNFTDENKNKYTFIPFSPPPPRRKEPFWGNTKPIPITKKPVQDKGKSILGNRELEVDPDSVLIRSSVSRRKPTQNEVMGMSAKGAYEFFYEDWADKLTPDMRQIFERAINADLRNPMESNYRPEWLHAEGFSLTPVWIDPQREDNLGSGPKWANTAMMVLERVAKWYALNCPESFISIKPKFEMLFKTDLIETIDFNVRVGFEDRFLRFMQHIEPLTQKYPVFPKASDIAQITGISQSILSDKPPAVVSVIPTKTHQKKSLQKNFKGGQFLKPTDENKDLEIERDTTSINTSAEIDECNSSCVTAKPSKKGLFAPNAHRYNFRNTPAREYYTCN